ncbi:MAG TPA: hypothetical protein VI564_09500 [Candidatus Nanoarchaeia archaeon]|nr:hypothetical protein [Candidatus Nanoarchaeia archaeon]
MANENVNKNEQVGFHKGALTTLAKEREELMRILSIVEQLMQMHIKNLKELGVDLQKSQPQAASESNAKPKSVGKKHIEDALR